MTENHLLGADITHSLLPSPLLAAVWCHRAQQIGGLQHFCAGTSGACLPEPSPPSAHGHASRGVAALACTRTKAGAALLTLGLDTSRCARPTIHEIPAAAPEHHREVKSSCCRRSNRRCRSNSFVLLVDSANACLSAMAQNSRRQRQLLRCIPARSGTLPEAERNLAPAPGHV